MQQGSRFVFSEDGLVLDEYICLNGNESANAYDNGL